MTTASSRLRDRTWFWLAASLTPLATIVGIAWCNGRPARLSTTSPLTTSRRPAEGVETVGQLRLMLESGVELAQGDLLVRPAPGDVISELLAAGRST